ncbi:hypothetical protein MJO28_005280 [Puccinia striiformis f. sp. tritici]|uniref:Uncharacterized protein n=1 Tax=Puccinia striiformis f. sp. tritici TaxID=168172 RepID=A0ACC0EK93_9BASI|nr:hypothetical protein MJO28_005280 [Puccinia striiformis f. sp. tritici]KAI7960250.1 hypothetical protein MJO29_005318 [Puccinia striiformis f. sp. tritici]
MNFVILPMIFFLTVIHPKTGLAIDSARLSTTKQIRPGARAAAQLECKPLAGLQALKDKSLYLTLNINPESLIPMNQTIRRSEMLAASMAQKQNDVRLFFFFPVPAIFKHYSHQDFLGLGQSFNIFDLHYLVELKLGVTNKS